VPRIILAVPRARSDPGSSFVKLLYSHWVPALRYASTGNRKKIDVIYT
jgi:hypothetical protein